MSKYLVIAALIALAFGQTPTANDCNGGSCSADSGCMYGQRCCNGKCYQGLTGTVALGGTCSSSPTSCTQVCAVGTCQSNVCSLTGYGPQCTGTCATNADCAGGLTCNNIVSGAGTCGVTGLGPGAPCSLVNLCATGFSCVGGTCVGSSAGQPCTTSGITYIDPVNSLWPSNCTSPSTAFCWLGSGSFGTCYNKIANGNTPLNTASASLATMAASCVSGIALNTTAVFTCIAKNTVATGAQCQLDTQCSTGYCNLTNAVAAYAGVCGATKTIPLWNPCTRYLQQDQCVAGSFCSHNTTTGWYTCMPGSLNGLAAGATCINDDQCLLGGNCTYPATSGLTPGVCTSVIGQPCVPTLGGGLMQCLSHNGGVGCYCTSGSYTCQLPPSVSASCSAQSAAVTALLASGGYGLTPVNILSVGPDANRAVVYASSCCTACAIGLANYAWSVNGYQQYLTLNYNCKAGTYTQLGSGDSTTRCQKSGTTAIPYGDIINTCSTGNSGTSSVVSPSIALLFSIVALVFLL